MPLHIREALGPKIQGNLLGIEDYLCVPFNLEIPDCGQIPLDFEGIRAFVTQLESRYRRRAESIGSGMDRPSALETAAAFVRAHHPDAVGALLAGSVVRGEATETSDLDVVVLYRSLPNAYRTSHRFQGWPIEAFVHEPATLHWFYRIGRADVPSLQNMVAEGVPVCVAEAGWIETLQAEARALCDAGPPAWTEEELSRARYGLTDVRDDLRSPRNAAELSATAARLYHPLANFWLRTQGHWGASGKTIPRTLERLDADFHRRFVGAFASAHAGDAAGLVQLVDDVLGPAGGELFDGYVLPAPASWRVPEPELAHLQLVSLIVRDYDPAIRFFCDVLGFSLTQDEPSLTNDGRPKRWVVVRPEAGTGLLLAKADGTEQEAQVGKQMAGRVGFFLRVPNFEASYERMRAAGVHFVGTPRTEGYGQIVVFHDLEGNPWDLLGPVA